MGTAESHLDKFLALTRFVFSDKKRKADAIAVKAEPQAGRWPLNGIARLAAGVSNALFSRKKEIECIGGKNSSESPSRHESLLTML